MAISIYASDGIRRNTFPQISGSIGLFGVAAFATPTR